MWVIRNRRVDVPWSVVYSKTRICDPLRPVSLEGPLAHRFLACNFQFFRPFLILIQELFQSDGNLIKRTTLRGYI